MWLTVLSYLFGGLACVLLFDLAVTAASPYELASLVVAAKLPGVLLAGLAHVVAFGFATVSREARRNTSTLEGLVTASVAPAVLPSEALPVEPLPVADSDDRSTMPAWLADRIRSDRPVPRAP